MSEGSHDGAAGPIKRSLRTFLIVMTLIVCWQLYLNQPKDRPVVGCWAAYKAVHFTIVTIPKWAIPREHTFILDNVYRSEHVYNKCVGWFGSKYSIDKPDEIKRREEAHAERERKESTSKERSDE